VAIGVPVNHWAWRNNSSLVRLVPPVADGNGNWYGVTYEGGTFGVGVVYESRHGSGLGRFAGPRGCEREAESVAQKKLSD
jgi:hypothetical protein